MDVKTSNIPLLSTAVLTEIEGSNIGLNGGVARRSKPLDWVEF